MLVDKGTTKRKVEEILFADLGATGTVVKWFQGGNHERSGSQLKLFKSSKATLTKASH